MCWISMMTEAFMIKSMVSLTMPEWLVFDNEGIVWSKAVVWGTVVRRISNVWVVWGCIVGTESNSMSIVGIEEWHMSNFVWGNVVPIMLKDRCVVCWTIMISMVTSVVTINIIHMVLKWTIVMISIVSMDQFSNSSVDWMMDWCVGIMMSVVVDSMLWEIMVNWCVGIMVDIMSREVVVHWTMSIMVRSGMATVVSVVLKEVVMSWGMSVMVSIMVDSVLWEVVVIIMISVSFPTSTMVIMMHWSMVVRHIMVFSISIVMMSWTMSIMMSTVLWEVVIIMVISMGFPTGSMVIMMHWGMVVRHVVVFSVTIVVVSWSMSIMVVDCMTAKMGIDTMWVMDWGVD